MRTQMTSPLFLALLITSPNPWPPSPAFADSKPKAIKFGKLVDGTGKSLPNAVVIVKDDRIVSVGSGNVATPPDSEVIDLTRFTGIPGLIDVHTHMTFYWDGAAGTRPWQQIADRMPAVTVFLAQENARKTLESGVTTVRDLRADHYNDIAMRDLINRSCGGRRRSACGYQRRH